MFKLKIKIMKNLNGKSVVIGFLSCVVIFLVFGFKTVETNTNPVGTYQSFVSGGYVNMINTSTGEIYTNNKIQVTRYKWRSISNKDIFKNK